MQYSRDDSDSSTASPPNLFYPAHQQQPPLHHSSSQDFTYSRQQQHASTSSITMPAQGGDFDMDHSTPVNLQQAAVAAVGTTSNVAPDPSAVIRRPRKLVGQVPPPGSIVLEKSCARCRIRKVKCDRVYPVCTNCHERREDCDLVNLPTRRKAATIPDLTEVDRIARLERRLVELEYLLATVSTNPNTKSIAKASIGPGSIDWTLARPTMAQSLTQHLCEAFLDSCCAFLPAFTYFHTRIPNYRGDPMQLSPAMRVAIAAFCTIGARASPHSAVLGIECPLTPTDSNGASQALVLSAGGRRQTACSKLLSQANAMSYEEAVMDETTVENLAALMAMLQLTIFAELVPKRSRSLLRAGLAHYKDLQDSASSEQEKLEIKKAFALGLYSTDALTSSYSRRACMITNEDLRQYFSGTDIVVPNLLSDNLTGTLSRLLASSLPQTVNLKTACHLLICWTSACHRSFAEMVAPPAKPTAAYEALILALWAAVDQTRAAVQLVQNFLYSRPEEMHDHTDHSTPRAPAHSHETDFIMQTIRQDRDLLDLFSMSHTFLTSLRWPGLSDMLVESERRVRRGLKTLAFYAKVYIGGADAHMLFHHAFQMELNPIWTKMALQRVGEPGGPAEKGLEVSEVELGWLIEGLQHACYYMPSAGQRLEELESGFAELESAKVLKPIPSATFPTSRLKSDNASSFPSVTLPHAVNRTTSENSFPSVTLPHTVSRVPSIPNLQRPHSPHLRTQHSPLPPLIPLPLQRQQQQQQQQLSPSLPHPPGHFSPSTYYHTTPSPAPSPNTGASGIGIDYEGMLLEQGGAYRPDYLSSGWVNDRYDVYGHQPSTASG